MPSCNSIDKPECRPKNTYTFMVRKTSQYIRFNHYWNPSMSCDAVWCTYHEFLAVYRRNGNSSYHSPRLSVLGGQPCSVSASRSHKHSPPPILLLTFCSIVKYVPHFWDSFPKLASVTRSSVQNHHQPQ